MKLSLYTAVKDGVKNDLHFEAMLKHHLDLADEIIVNEGFSKDDTYERLQNIDPKIKIFRTIWEKPRSIKWCVGFKDEARKKCKGDWCIHLDCDEFIPEWQFQGIRSLLEKTDRAMIPVKFINFYGNYKVYHSNPRKTHWPEKKMIIHKNLPEIEFWGDGSNVRMSGHKFQWDNSKIRFVVHHFGMVRSPAILRYKWWVQGRAVSGKSSKLIPPQFLFRLFPHNWMDQQFFSDLKIFEGQVIKAVRNNPKEFVRDDMKLYRAITSK